MKYACPDHVYAWIHGTRAGFCESWVLGDDESLGDGYNVYTPPPRDTGYDWHRAYGEPPRRTSIEPYRSPAVERALRELNLRWPTTTEAVQQAFRRAALQRHPDQNRGVDRGMVPVTEARETLLKALRSP